jgi:CheY-like chemotaxis protein
MDARLIFLDYDMPERNGIEAASCIRELEQKMRSREVPIIGLSGFDSQHLQASCLEAGMNQVLSKPIKKADVVAALKKYC